MLGLLVMACCLIFRAVSRFPDNVVLSPDDVLCLSVAEEDACTVESCTNCTSNSSGVLIIPQLVAYAPNDHYSAQIYCSDGFYDQVFTIQVHVMAKFAEIPSSLTTSQLLPLSLQVKPHSNVPIPLNFNSYFFFNIALSSEHHPQDAGDESYISIQPFYTRITKFISGQSRFLIAPTHLAVFLYFDFSIVVMVNKNTTASLYVYNKLEESGLGHLKDTLFLPVNNIKSFPVDLPPWELNYLHYPEANIMIIYSNSRWKNSTRFLSYALNHMVMESTEIEGRMLENCSKISSMNVEEEYSVLLCFESATSSYGSFVLVVVNYFPLFATISSSLPLETAFAKNESLSFGVSLEKIIERSYSNPTSEHPDFGAYIFLRHRYNDTSKTESAFSAHHISFQNISAFNFSSRYDFTLNYTPSSILSSKIVWSDDIASSSSESLSENNTKGGIGVVILTTNYSIHMFKSKSSLLLYSSLPINAQDEDDPEKVCEEVLISFDHLEDQRLVRLIRKEKTEKYWRLTIVSTRLVTSRRILLDKIFQENFHYLIDLIRLSEDESELLTDVMIRNQVAQKYRYERINMTTIAVKIDPDLPIFHHSGDETQDRELSYTLRGVNLMTERSQFEVPVKISVEMNKREKDKNQTLITRRSEIRLHEIVNMSGYYSILAHYPNQGIRSNVSTSLSILGTYLRSYSAVDETDPSIVVQDLMITPDGSFYISTNSRILKCDQGLCNIEIGTIQRRNYNKSSSRRVDTEGKREHIKILEVDEKRNILRYCIVDEEQGTIEVFNNTEHFILDHASAKKSSLKREFNNHKRQLITIGEEGKSIIKQEGVVHLTKGNGWIEEYVGGGANTIYNSYDDEVQASLNIVLMSLHESSSHHNVFKIVVKMHEGNDEMLVQMNVSYFIDRRSPISKNKEYLVSGGRCFLISNRTYCYLETTSTVDLLFNLNITRLESHPYYKLNDYQLHYVEKNVIETILDIALCKHDDDIMVYVYSTSQVLSLYRLPLAADSRSSLHVRSSLFLVKNVKMMGLSMMRCFEDLILLLTSDSAMHLYRTSFSVLLNNFKHPTEVVLKGFQDLDPKPLKLLIVPVDKYHSHDITVSMYAIFALLAMLLVLLFLLLMTKLYFNKATFDEEYASYGQQEQATTSNEISR